MLFRNALRLFMENFKNVYKILIYKFIVAIVAAALYSALLLPQVIEILESVEMAGLIANVKEFIFALLDGNSDGLHAIREQIISSANGVLSFISTRTIGLILSVVGCVLVYLLARFTDTLCYFSMGDMLGDKMESYAETPFWASYVKNLAKGSLYSVVYVCAIFLFDAVILAGCYFLFFYLTKFLNLVLSVFLSVTCIVLANALKLTLTSVWMPAMTADDKSLKKAIQAWNGVDKKFRWGVFSTYLVSVYLVLSVNVIGLLTTFGSSVFLTLPASYFYFICLQYVNYYTLTGKKYFLTHERIVTNELHGDESLAVEFIAHAGEEKAELKEENKD